MGLLEEYDGYEFTGGKKVRNYARNMCIVLTVVFVIMLSLLLYVPITDPDRYQQILNEDRPKVVMGFIFIFILLIPIFLAYRGYRKWKANPLRLIVTKGKVYISPKAVLFNLDDDNDFVMDLEDVREVKSTYHWRDFEEFVKLFKEGNIKVQNPQKVKKLVSGLSGWGIFQKIMINSFIIIDSEGIYHFISKDFDELSRILYILDRPSRIKT